jgi:heptosyltransferase III
MYFSVHFYIKILKNTKKILIIIQRSNGDVLLSLSLINNLHNHYPNAEIDLLINDDTFAVADLLPNIKNIHIFSYQRKNNERLKQEFEIIFRIYRKYDLSINLTASDRSVIYSILSSNKSISAVEKNIKKSWWKKLLLKHYYYFEPEKHILENNLESLNLLKINHKMVQDTPILSDLTYKIVKSRLKKMSINSFLIFHPSAQYNYKIYPKELRDKLLNYLNDLGLPILITGGNNQIDLEIKKQLPSLKNIIDLIGETSLPEYFALSDLSLAYIGMDTLNMHIAAGQNKPIFAIFGPTKISMWSPWSNQLMTSTINNEPIQTYGKNTIFQSSSPCGVCGIVGCGSNHGKNEFDYVTEPEEIFNEINQWISKLKD